MTAGPARILVVDDDPHVRNILREYLSDGTRQRVTASSSAEALAKLDGEAVSLVLSTPIRNYANVCWWAPTLARQVR